MLFRLWEPRGTKVDHHGKQDGPFAWSSRTGHMFLFCIEDTLSQWLSNLLAPGPSFLDWAMIFNPSSALMHRWRMLLGQIGENWQGCWGQRTRVLEAHRALWLSKCRPTYAYHVCPKWAQQNMLCRRTKEHNLLFFKKSTQTTPSLPNNFKMALVSATSPSSSAPVPPAPFHNCSFVLGILWECYLLCPITRAFGWTVHENSLLRPSLLLFCPSPIQGRRFPLHPRYRLGGFLWFPFCFQAS